MKIAPLTKFKSDKMLCECSLTFNVLDSSLDRLDLSKIPAADDAAIILYMMQFG